MTQGYVRNGGTWKPFVAAFVRNGGVWKQLQGGFVHNGGTWKQFLAGITITSSNFASSFTSSPSTVAPAVNFLADGTVVAKNSAGSYVADGNWATPTTGGIGSSYWINMTNVSGTGTMSGTFGSWVAISTAPAWSMAAPGTGQEKDRHCTYQIASDSGGATIVGSGRCDFLSDRT